MPNFLADPDDEEWLGRGLYGHLEDLRPRRRDPFDDDPEGEPERAVPGDWVRLEERIHKVRGAPLSGVVGVVWSNLERALELECARVGHGLYAVWHPNPSGKRTTEDRYFDPTPGPRRPEDTLKWVSLYNYDDTELCYCKWMMTDGYGFRSPCKHVLRALLAEENETIVQLAAELLNRRRIARAMRE